MMVFLYPRLAGHTLLELLAVLVIAGIAMGLAAPPLRRLGDTAAVVGARERLVGAIGLARVSAVSRGGAEVRLRVEPPGAWVLVGPDTLAEVRLDRVELTLGGREGVTLTFDPVGVGRLAGATIGIERGGVERSLVVSSFGRVRRR